MEMMAERVNDAILEAAGTDPMMVDDKTTRVTRWDAKRELLDDVIETIKKTREERDNITNMRRDENG